MMGGAQPNRHKTDDREWIWIESDIINLIGNSDTYEQMNGTQQNC